MDVLTRLKMELSNQEYFPDNQYTQFLMENNLVATETYNKEIMYKQRKCSIASTFCNQLSSAIIVSYYTQSKKFSS